MFASYTSAAETFDLGKQPLRHNFDNSIHKFSKAGEDLGVITSLLGIGCPGDLVVDPNDVLLEVDPCSNIVRKFSLTGDSLGILASTGLSAPLGIALDASGNIFVSNSAGQFQNTIREFSATGDDLGVFASTGLSFPARLAIDPAGEVFVAIEPVARRHTRRFLDPEIFGFGRGPRQFCDDAGRAVRTRPDRARRAGIGWWLRRPEHRPITPSAGRIDETTSDLPCHTRFSIVDQVRCQAARPVLQRASTSVVKSLVTAASPRESCTHSCGTTAR